MPHSYPFDDFTFKLALSPNQSLVPSNHSSLTEPPRLSPSPAPSGNHPQSTDISANRPSVQYPCPPEAGIASSNSPIATRVSRKGRGINLYSVASVFRPKHPAQCQPTPLQQSLLNPSSHSFSSTSTLPPSLQHHLPSTYAFSGPSESSIRSPFKRLFIRPFVASPNTPPSAHNHFIPQASVEATSDTCGTPSLSAFPLPPRYRNVKTPFHSRAGSEDQIPLLLAHRERVDAALPKKHNRCQLSPYEAIPSGDFDQNNVPPPDKSEISLILKPPDLRQMQTPNNPRSSPARALFSDAASAYSYVTKRKFRSTPPPSSSSSNQYGQSGPEPTSKHSRMNGHLSSDSGPGPAFCEHEDIDAQMREAGQRRAPINENGENGYGDHESGADQERHSLYSNFETENIQRESLCPSGLSFTKHSSPRNYSQEEDSSDILDRYAEMSRYDIAPSNCPSQDPPTTNQSVQDLIDSYQRSRGPSRTSNHSGYVRGFSSFNFEFDDRPSEPSQDMPEIPEKAKTRAGPPLNQLPPAPSLPKFGEAGKDYNDFCRSQPTWAISSETQIYTDTNMVLKVSPTSPLDTLRERVARDYIRASQDEDQRPNLSSNWKYGGLQDYAHSRSGEANPPIAPQASASSTRTAQETGKDCPVFLPRYERASVNTNLIPVAAFSGQQIEPATKALHHHPRAAYQEEPSKNAVNSQTLPKIGDLDLAPSEKDWETVDESHFALPTQPIPQHGSSLDSLYTFSNYPIHPANESFEYAYRLKDYPEHETPVNVPHYRFGDGQVFRDALTVPRSSLKSQNSPQDLSGNQVVPHDPTASQFADRKASLPVLHEQSPNKSGDISPTRRLELHTDRPPKISIPFSGDDSWTNQATHGSAEESHSSLYSPNIATMNHLRSSDPRMASTPLASDNTYAKYTLMGPSKNLTGTPGGTNQKYTGSSVVGDSSCQTFGSSPPHWSGEGTVGKRQSPTSPKTPSPLRKSFKIDEDGHSPTTPSRPATRTSANRRDQMRLSSASSEEWYRERERKAEEWRREFVENSRREEEEHEKAIQHNEEKRQRNRSSVSSQIHLRTLTLVGSGGNPYESIDPAEDERTRAEKAAIPIQNRQQPSNKRQSFVQKYFNTAKPKRPTHWSIAPVLRHRRTASQAEEDISISAAQEKASRRIFICCCIVPPFLMLYGFGCLDGLAPMMAGSDVTRPSPRWKKYARYTGLALNVAILTAVILIALFLTL